MYFMITKDELIDMMLLWSEAIDKYERDNYLYKPLFGLSLLGFQLDRFRPPTEEAENEIVKLFEYITLLSEIDQKYRSIANKIWDFLPVILANEPDIKTNMQRLSRRNRISCAPQIAKKLLVLSETDFFHYHQLFRKLYNKLKENSNDFEIMEGVKSDIEEIYELTFKRKSDSELKDWILGVILSITNEIHHYIRSLNKFNCENISSISKNKEIASFISYISSKLEQVNDINVNKFDKYFDELFYLEIAHTNDASKSIVKKHNFLSQTKQEFIDRLRRLISQDIDLSAGNSIADYKQLIAFL